VTRFACLVAFALTACPPVTPPVPPTPDASDAASTPVQDASAATDAPPVPTTPCQAACDRMTAICGPQPPNCVTVMADEDGARILREPEGGRPLMCGDIAAATDKAAMQAIIGAGCP
jgi:hypothetical protein